MVQFGPKLDHVPKMPCAPHKTIWDHFDNVLKKKARENREKIPLKAFERST